MGTLTGRDLLGQERDGAVVGLYVASTAGMVGRHAVEALLPMVTS